MPLLCRTFALNAFYNHTRDIYKNPKGFEKELLSLCCIVKTMMSWNLNNVAVTCRERCGGMGYLAVSKFSDYIATAHASITAEGDNRVLMTKIAKDYMSNVKFNGFKVPKPSMSIKNIISKMEDVSNADVLLDLLKFREGILFESLVTRMATLAKEGKSGYQILMREVSDNIQDLSMAYGERNTLEASLALLAKLSGENKKVMTVVFRVFAIDCVKMQLGFYLKKSAVSREAAKKLLATQNDLIKTVASNIESLLACLNVPIESLYAPIAKDYEKFYSAPNYGEVIGARL